MPGNLSRDVAAPATTTLFHKQIGEFATRVTDTMLQIGSDAIRATQRGAAALKEYIAQGISPQQMELAYAGGGSMGGESCLKQSTCSYILLLIFSNRTC